MELLFILLFVLLVFQVIVLNSLMRHESTWAEFATKAKDYVEAYERVKTIHNTNNLVLSSWETKVNQLLLDVEYMKIVVDLHAHALGIKNFDLDKTFLEKIKIEDM